MAPIVNEPTAVSTTDDDLDLGAFIKELEVVEEESGCQLAGAGTTDTSSRYNAQQKKLVQSYVDFLGKFDRYKKLVELVNNPIRSGGPRQVAKILVVLSGIITDDKRHLANKTITHWQTELKREKPDENGCPYFAPSSQNQKLRTLFSALTKFHGWHLKLDSLRGFDGSLAGQLSTLYKERSEKYPVFGVPKKNRVAVEDSHKVLLSKFDESIPEQHQMKCLVGCGVYFGFRGVEEHAQLLVEQIVQGVFEPGHKYAGKTYVGIGHLKTDKKRKLTVNTSYLRDTKNIMRIPIVDDYDDPTSNCFASSLLRMLKKAGKGQKRFYCYYSKNTGYQAKKPKGKNVISKMRLKAANLLTIEKEESSSYQDKTNDLPAHSRSLYQRPANSRQAVAMANDLVSSVYNQCLIRPSRQKIARKHHQGPTKLSAAHLEIRKLRMKLHDLTDTKNAMQQDHRLDVRDYEERISDMEWNFQYDNNNGNWYSDRKKRHSY